MSLHPLNQEVLATEVLVIAASGYGGVALRDCGHPYLGTAAWAFGGLVPVVILGMAIAERDTHPPLEVLLAVVAGVLESRREKAKQGGD